MNLNLWQMIGPITMLSAFALMAHLPIGNFDLAMLGILGIYISASYLARGCRLALFFLIFWGFIAHLLWESSHFVRLALEMNLGLSFIITALGFEMKAQDQGLLESKISTQKGVIQNLEDEKLQLSEGFALAHMDNEKKLEELQKNFDETLSEKSTLEILNDVLRKTNATHLKEKTEIQKQILEDQTQFFSKIQTADFKIHELSQLEPLYKQLKGQFEEKTRVLHETRSSLFKLETELQRMNIEKEQEEPLLGPLHAEIRRFEEEVDLLTSENQELLELVTHLTNTLPIAQNRTPLPKVKSTVKETLREALTPKKKKKKKLIQK